MEPGWFAAPTVIVLGILGPAPAAAARLAGPSVTDQVLAQLLADLKSTSLWTRKRACEKLAGLKPTAERAQVAAALEPLLEDPDFWTRRAAMKALGVWGTKQSVPALLKLLKNPDVFTRRAALLALADLKDERAAAPAAECLKDFFSRGEATKVLQALGPAAEKDVLRVLKEGDLWQRQATCRLLKDIGTKDSIPALQEVIDAQDIRTRVHVAPSAQEALNAIKAREEKR
jgi:HEAT repeat protein